jgi:predicted nucleic acid-binding Zn ribbon protein
MATSKRATAAGHRKPRPNPIHQRILREWRGADEAADLSAGIHSAGDFVQAILRAAGVEDSLNEEQVRSAWKELAGDFIARHSEPVSVKGGHLVLKVAQPSMRFHLEQMKPMLLLRIREKLGDNHIKSVKFTLG